MTGPRGLVLRGAAAGAAGTTALNAFTYLDMAVRGRPASTTPERSVETIAERVGLTVPGEDGRRANRLTGLGQLSGTATGIGVGIAAGILTAGLTRRVPGGILSLLLGAAAMAASNIPMTRLGVTDPRTWRPADWAADVIPHLAYGAAGAAVLRAMTPTSPNPATAVHRRG